MHRRVALLVLVAALLIPRLSSATTADNICSPAADPCVLNSVLSVSAGSTLDFGTRTFQIGAAGTINVAGGDTLLIKAGTLQMLAGALIRKTPASANAPTISIQTTGNIEMQSTAAKSKIDLSAENSGGFLMMEANGNVSLNGDLLAKGTTVDGDGGTITISAGGNATITGDVTIFGGADAIGGELSVTATGSIVMNGTIVDATGGLEGGSLDLEAGTNLSTTTKLIAAGTGAGSDGGFVTLIAKGNLTLGGLLNASGSGSIDFGGFGGDIEIGATGSIQLNDKIDISGGSPDGEGGTADISAGIDLVQAGQLLAVGPGGFGFGGTLLLSAVNIVRLTQLIDLHGGTDGGGGYLSAQTGTEVRAQGEINANGDGGYILLSTLHEPDPTDPLMNFVTGSVTASGNIHANAAPAGFGGQISLLSCDISVPAGATLATLGDSSLNLLQASGQLTVGGALTADGGAGGTAMNRFEYRNPAKPPLIQPSASITPTASSVPVTTLPPCGAVCGNGVTEAGEQCDKGAANGTPGSGCNVLCKTAEVCGTASGPACIPCGGDVECHPLGICGGSQCLAGVCTAVAVPNCNDGNACTTDRCDSPSGCVHEMQSGAGVAGCDDGNVCNGAETCNAGTCTPGTPPPDDDGDLCTDEAACDPLRGTPHTAKEGFPSATCRLDTIEAALRSAVAPGDITEKVRAKLEKSLTALRGKIAQAESASGKKRGKMLKAAGKQIAKLVKLIGAAAKKSQIKASLADTLTRAAGRGARRWCFATRSHKEGRGGGPVPMANDRIISADSHVNPPKDLWTRSAPEKLRARAPRVESTPQGDFWIVDSQVSGAIGLDASAGRKPEDFKPMGLGYKDMRPGSYDPAARLADMDMDGVDAEVLYFGGPVTQLAKDAELRMFVVRTYNDWMVELSKAAPGRLVGLAHIPLLDLDEALAELARVAKLGLRGFHIDPFPDERGGKALWDPAYEPLWSLAEETGMPISFHIVGPRNQNVAATFMNPAPGVKETFIAIAPISICEVVSTLTFTGILERHPRLNYVLVECGIGWIPYFVERMDQTFNKHRFWTKSVITEKPSTYWYRQGHATFIQDLAGVAERHRAGLENILWSTDYPHSDSTWPHSREALAQHFDGVPANERALIAGGNAAKLYHLN